MDRFAAAIANMLAGNDIDKPVLELHFPASVFWFKNPVLIGLSGADFAATVNGESIPVNHPIVVGKNSLLQFHKAAKGARAYMAVHGGYNVLPWLNSCSTHLKVEKGGTTGRALKANDEIAINKKTIPSSLLHGNASVLSSR